MGVVGEFESIERSALIVSLQNFVIQRGCSGAFELILALNFRLNRINSYILN